MQFDTFKRITDLIVDRHHNMTNYVDRLPGDLVESILENQYASNQGLLNDMLMEELFGPVLHNDVTWFLYEWEPGSILEHDGTLTTINTLGDFFTYMQTRYVW